MNSPAEVAQNYITIGKGKANLSIAKMLLLGFMAGMFIALAGVAATFGNAYVNKAAGAAIFPAGLAMVLIAGSELFTGNCLLIIPTLTKDIKVGQMLKNWLFVYIGNLIGSIFVAGFSVLAGCYKNEAVLAAITAAATSKVALSFGTALCKGIMCNILVCIAVWMSFAAKSVVGKIVGLFFPIMAFVIAGFEHSIANMFYIPAGIFLGLEGVSWGNFFVVNLIPVTLGNIIGGCLVGVVYWAVYLKKKN